GGGPSRAIAIGEITAGRRLRRRRSWAESSGDGGALAGRMKVGVRGHRGGKRRGVAAFLH
ncbi:unnamed protein product, partial [Musa textilis]